MNCSRLAAPIGWRSGATSRDAVLQNGSRRSYMDCTRPRPLLALKTQLDGLRKEDRMHVMPQERTGRERTRVARRMFATACTTGLRMPRPITIANMKPSPAIFCIQGTRLSVAKLN